MKRKVLLMMIAVMLAIMSGACRAELPTIPGNQSVVDYSGSPDEWIHIPETEDTTIACLVAIAQCRYGSAGASLSQADAACKLLKLTHAEDIETALPEYLDGMDATQLDYFSFQWQMCLSQAQAFLSSPESYTGILADSGNEFFDISVYTTESLAELNTLVMSELASRNVCDVWKDYPDIEPFTEAAKMSVIHDADFYSVCTSFSKYDVEQFAKEIRELILSSNWKKLSTYVAYPITIDEIIYEDDASLIRKLSETNLSEQAIASIQNEDCIEMFCKYSGIMMGNGEVWIGEVLNEDSASEGLRVIALHIFKEQ